jgi:hypothetical protein
MATYEKVVETTFQDKEIISPMPVPAPEFLWDDNGVKWEYAGESGGYDVPYHCWHSPEGECMSWTTLVTEYGPLTDLQTPAESVMPAVHSIQYLEARIKALVEENAALQDTIENLQAEVEEAQGEALYQEEEAGYAREALEIVQNQLDEIRDLLA